MDDLFSESGVNEYWFDTLLKGGMVGIKDDEWYVTVHGADAFNYVASSRIWSNYHCIRLLHQQGKGSRRGPGDGMFG